MKEAASKTADAGDGTTTATALPKQSLKKEQRSICRSQPVDIQRGIKLGEQAVPNSIREMSLD